MANTIVYLWAYADHDNDGRINEEGEAVGAASSDDSGRLPTGSTSQVYDIEMALTDDGPVGSSDGGE